MFGGGIFKKLINKYMNQEEKKPFEPFGLNFGNEDRMVTITLPEQDGIFKLADAFVKFLNENNITNEVKEFIKENPVQDANQNN